MSAVVMSTRSDGEVPADTVVRAHKGGKVEIIASSGMKNSELSSAVEWYGWGECMKAGLVNMKSCRMPTQCRTEKREEDGRYIR